MHKMPVLPICINKLYRKIGFNVIKSGTAGDGNIVALTGATITSQAVTDAVNSAIDQYK